MCPRLILQTPTQHQSPTPDDAPSPLRNPPLANPPRHPGTTQTASRNPATRYSRETHTDPRNHRHPHPVNTSATPRHTGPTTSGHHPSIHSRTAMYLVQPIRTPVQVPSCSSFQVGSNTARDPSNQSVPTHSIPMRDCRGNTTKEHQSSQIHPPNPC